MAPTRRTSARHQLKTPNTVNVTRAEQATAGEHIITPCRGDDRPGSFAKRAKIPWRGNLSRRSKKASAAKRKREEETEVEASLRLSSQSQRRQARIEKLLAMQPTPLQLPFDGPRRPRLRKPHVTQRKLRQRPFDGPRNPWLKTARHAADAAAASAARASESSAEKRTRRQRDAISTSAARAVKEPTERLERLQTVNQRRHAQRGHCAPPKQFWFKLVFNYEPVLRLSGRKNLQIGSMSVVCGHCNAKKWPGVSAGLCCSDSKVQLPPFQELPDPLKALLEGSSPDSKHFLAKIRQYNCAFQMTSFGVNAFREVGWNPTFKVQGQVYHRIGSLLPETATDSAFLQIYFIADYNQQADARMGIIPENDTGQDNHPRRDIIMSLQQMLHETNSYVRNGVLNIFILPPSLISLNLYLSLSLSLSLFSCLFIHCLILKFFLSLLSLSLSFYFSLSLPLSLSLSLSLYKILIHLKILYFLFIFILFLTFFFLSFFLSFSVFLILLPLPFFDPLSLSFLSLSLSLSLSLGW
ncbi:unnamed protein product [Acanthosepion pharaonis]|uniref:Helitron helicase-like domain-containing protein n=1 Tax=Acanthosepion pharaonis TaxID=158019 RepID=A0A812CQM4_ACAPH|nr:unnamed protein product [Sepia pharaonis]